ncbi:MAG: hypothetical protein ACW99Q_28360 [Candidatus Kariarchaeaceae archaeon]|jgi:hypothetical protein
MDDTDMIFVAHKNITDFVSDTESIPFLVIIDEVPSAFELRPNRSIWRWERY